MINKNICAVCKSNLREPASQLMGEFPSSLFRCPRCGDYFLSYDLIIFLPEMLSKDDEKIAILSYAIKKRQREQYPPRLDKEIVENILKTKLPNPSEQADNLILWLGEAGERLGPGEILDIEPITHQSIIGARTENGFALIVEHLFNDGLVKGHLDGSHIIDATLSFSGWKYFEQLKRGKSDSRKAFMAMKYGDLALERVVEDVFKPAVAQAGFHLFRLDERPKAGLIDDRLRVEIRTSKFLIADLTHENAGAYWEAGYAEGLGKPVIYTCERSKFRRDKTHFDTNHHLTIIWDKEQPEDAANTLKATIRATLPDEAKLIDD